jgi:hypothetical protein
VITAKRSFYPSSLQNIPLGGQRKHRDWDCMGHINFQSILLMNTEAVFDASKEIAAEGSTDETLHMFIFHY